MVKKALEHLSSIEEKRVNIVKQLKARDQNQTKEIERLRLERGSFETANTLLQNQLDNLYKVTITLNSFKLFINCPLSHQSCSLIRKKTLSTNNMSKPNRTNGPSDHSSINWPSKKIVNFCALILLVPESVLALNKYLSGKNAHIEELRKLKQIDDSQILHLKEVIRDLESRLNDANSTLTQERLNFQDLQSQSDRETTKRMVSLFTECIFLFSGSI